MILALVFYGTLAALALWATWRDEDFRWIGIMLVVGCTLSNIMYFTVPVTIWPGPYTLIEIMVALAAYVAWGATGYRALVVMVGVNLASVGINVAFAAVGDEPTDYQKTVFVVATNLCFTVECLLALSVGIAHGYRTGRFTRWPSFLGHAPQPNVTREGES